GGDARQQTHRGHQPRRRGANPRGRPSELARRSAPSDSSHSGGAGAPFFQGACEGSRLMPQREILWNVPPPALDLVYLLSALSAAWILFWYVRRSRRWARGGPAADQLGWRAGLKRLAGYLLTQYKIRTDPYAGWMHLLIFWGFITLLIATTLVA